MTNGFPCLPRIRRTVLSKDYGTEPEANAASAKLSTIQIAAMRKQASFAGPLTVCLPSMCYQLEGNRLFAIISVVELIDIMANDPSVPEELYKQPAPEVVKAGCTGMVGVGPL